MREKNENASKERRESEVSMESGAWFRLGLQFISTGRYGKAIASLMNALREDPGISDAEIALAYALDRAGRSQEAAGICERVLASRDSEEVLFVLAKAIYHMGKYAEAMRLLERVVRGDTSHAEAWHLMGNSLYHLGRYADAVECYRQATALDPAYVKAWFNKGVNYIALARFEDAIRCFDRCLELNTGFAEVWKKRGLALYALGRFEQAAESYAKAAEINPRDAQAFHSQGICLQRLGREEEAAAAFSRARSLPRIHELIGLV